MSEVTKMVDGLSDAQKQNLLLGIFTEDLARLGLCWFRAADIDFDAKGGPKPRPARWEWRPRGTRVRQYLMDATRQEQRR